MADSLIDLIKVLRDRTGAGLMDCKAALLNNDCDLDKAGDWLREKGLAKAAKKASRIAAEGLSLVKTCKCGCRVVVIEVNCETDFVAKGDAFRELVEALAQKVLDENLSTVEELKNASESLIADATVKMGEKFDIRRFVVLKKEEGQGLASYIHMGGKISVAVLLEKDDAELGKQLAMHIAANNPSYAYESDIPADVLAHEKEVQLAAAKNDPKLQNKPAEVLDKILDGKVKKTFAEMTLEDQAFLMDDSQTVGQILKNKGNKLLRFVRYQVGEGIEKRQDDFASEVMSQIK